MSGTRGIGVLAAIAALAALCVAAPASLGAKLPKNSVGTKQIRNKQVKKSDLAKAAVTLRSLAPGAVDGTIVADGALSGFDIANDSLGGQQVNEAALNLGHLQARVSGSCDPGAAIRAIDPTGTVACAPLGAPDVGQLGGDLSGTLPNPSIAGDAVNSAKVLNNALTGADLDESTLGKVPDSDALDGLDSGEFLLDGAGAGGDLSGTLPNPSIAPDAVTTPKILDDAVTAAKVPLNELGGNDILETALNGAAIPGVDAVTVDGQNASDFLGAGAIAGGDLGGAFSNLQLGNNVVGADEVALNALGTADIDEANLAGSEITGVNASQLGGVSQSAIDSRLDSLCAQADTVNQEVADLVAALNAVPGGVPGLDLSGVNLPDFDPAACQA